MRSTIAGLTEEDRVASFLRAVEAGRYNICVNCVSPGAIARDGNGHGHMTHLDEDGRMGTPQDIADAVLFLAGQDFITGENIVVDGGRSLGPSHR